MQRLALHPKNPQPRQIGRATEILRAGGLAIYPTDTTYGLGCDIFMRRAIDRIYSLKGLPKSHPLSVLCSDLSEVARYGVVDNRHFALLKRHLPGKFTFILPATREVPKVLQSGAKTVGIRIPQSPTCLALLRDLGHPIVSTTVSRAPIDPKVFLNDPDDIAKSFAHSAEVLLDVGPLEGQPSSVIDLCGERPTVLRQGSGDTAWVASA